MTDSMFTITKYSGFEVTVKARTAAELDDALTAHGLLFTPSYFTARAFMVPVGDTLRRATATIRRVS